MTGLIGNFCFFASIIEVFLARMMDKAIDNGVLKGLGNHLIPNGSEIFVVNGDDDIAMQYANLFNCQIGTFPMFWKKYLIAGRITTIDNLDKKGRSSFVKSVLARKK
ncbi:hypothetical protein ACJX0J_033987, partial [Zea mays]